MPTTSEINTKWLELHNQLGRRKDAIDKEVFDIAHQVLWAKCDVDLHKRLDNLLILAKLSNEETTELAELKFRLTV